MANEKSIATCSETKVNGPKLKAVWDANSINIFCELCIKEVEAGRRPGTHFDKVRWKNLCKNFSAATGRTYTKPQLKNKWDALKVDWKVWKDLIGKETGLGWNTVKKTVDASDDWWLSKLQTHPQASKFRKEGISPEMEEKLDRMFMNTTATGAYAWTPASGFGPSESGKKSDDNVIRVESYGDSEENNFQEFSKDIPKKRSNEQLGKQSTKWKKRNKKAKGGAALLVEGVHRLVDVVESYKTTEASSVSNTTPQFTITQCIEILKNLPGLDKALYFFATDLFCDKEKREVFMAIDEADKLSWLKYEHEHAK